MQDNGMSFNNNNNINSRNLNIGGSTKDDRSSINEQFHCSASSVESLPSASGSSEILSALKNSFSNCKIFQKGTQALVRSGSPNSSLSADDRATILPICRAKAIVDSSPFPYEKDALKFRVSRSI